MEWTLRILGANSAIPAHGRYPSSQILHLGDTRIMIDCGEGALLQLLRYGESLLKIDWVCISHLHGDHVFGLPAVLTTSNLLGRKHPLRIIGPRSIQVMIEGFLSHTGSELQYTLEFVELDLRQKEWILEGKYFRMAAFPLEHKVPTYGFLFEEKAFPRRLDVAMLERYGVPPEDRSAIAMGADWTDPSGQRIAHEVFVRGDWMPRSYAYCSDTRYFLQLAEWIKGVQWLYHEATFLREKQEEASRRMHSTAADAATVARQACVGKLLLGHFSSRYRDLTPFLEEARAIFPESYLAREGEVYKLKSLPVPG